MRTDTRILPKFNWHYKEYPINYIITTITNWAFFPRESRTAVIRFYNNFLHILSYRNNRNCKSERPEFVSFRANLIPRKSSLDNDDDEEKKGRHCSLRGARCYFLSSFFEALNPILAMRPSTTVAKVLSRCRARRRPSPRKFARGRAQCSACRIKRKTNVNYGRIALHRPWQSAAFDNSRCPSSF